MLMKPQAHDRACGDCTACCFTHAITHPDNDSLIKKFDTWCTNCEIGKGCAIYAQRPHPCKEFWCLWLHGYGPESDKPNEIGFVQSVEIDAPLTHTITLMEYLPGALGSQRAHERTAELLRYKQFVAHIPLTGQWTIYVPPGRSTDELDLEYLKLHDIRVCITT